MPGGARRCRADVGRRRAASGLIAVVWMLQPNAASTQPPALSRVPKLPWVSFYARNWTRIEAWRFFEPPPVEPETAADGHRQLERAVAASSATARVHLRVRVARRSVG